MNGRDALAGREPLAILIAALGGQGGGVLTDWIVHAARAQGMIAQATSTPGVSQRTGATTYYIEIAAPVAAGESPPVLGLTPLPARVDVLVCAEMLEAARMLERGFCTPERTTVVASTHRVYTTREKMDGADGRYDSAAIVGAVDALARRAVLFDADAVRTRHRAAISAALFGALAGSGALPIDRAGCEAAIRDAGKGVAESLAAFADAFEQATRARGPDDSIADAGVRAPAVPAGERPLVPALAAAIGALPGDVRDVARSGVERLVDYQGIAYAHDYLRRVASVARAEDAAGGPHPAHDVTREAARCLALWMSYDDIVRVAAQKSRAARFARIRREAGAGGRDVVRVFDFFKPGAREIADLMPRRIGEWLERRAEGAPPGRGIRLQSTSVAGALMLRCAAGMRWLRPHSLRFAREQAAIDRWLAAVTGALATPDGRSVALELARLPRLVKGYGDTHARGRAAFADALATAARMRESGAAATVTALRAIVKTSLDGTGCAAPGPAQAPRAQPINWVSR